MKKTVSILTAVAFALGLASAGLAQTTTGKEATKPATKMETPASQTQVTPAEKEKAGEKAGEKVVKPEAKKVEKGKKEAQVKKGQKAPEKHEHPASGPAEKSKPETK